VPGCVRPDPGLCAGGGAVEPEPPGEVVFPVPVAPVPVFPVPVVPVPVVPVPVVPVPVVPAPVFPVPVFPVPVFPVPVFPVPVFPVPVLGGSLLGMRYDKGAAKGISPDWPNVAMTAPPAPMNCPVVGRNTTGWVDPSPK
jgi:hypothetical protein